MALAAIGADELPFHAYICGNDLFVRLPRAGVAYDVTVYSTSGALMSRSSMTTGYPQAASLPAGVYIVRTTGKESGASYTAKTVIR